MMEGKALDAKTLLYRFLDEEGRLRQFPAKQAMKQAAYAYLAEKFEPGRDYTEQEVNAVISTWHTFSDYFLLRRGLVESGWLCRVPNGSRYWRNPDRKPEESPVSTGNH